MIHWKTHLRVPRAAAPVATFAGTLAVVLTAGSVIAGVGSAHAGNRPGPIRMNQIQYLGIHNAYHRELQGAELAAVLAVDPTYPTWGQYSHASIPDQLERQHARGVELDLLPDPQGGLYRYPLARRVAGLGPIDDPAMSAPGTKVMHVADADYNTSCRTFVACLQQVREWSVHHPRHVPIVLQLELKETEDQIERLGGAVSPPWDADRLADVDREIRSVFPEQNLITADDLRRPGLTLEQSVLRYGWPTLDQARGKVICFFDNGGPGEVRDRYLAGHPNLEGRAVFTQGRPGDPDAAITMVNDPRDGNDAVIRDLVARGYLVRTRSDEPLDTVKNREYGRVAIALGSGAQLVTTDFPVAGMAARYDSDFVADLPGGVVARCNPVTAPPGCRPGDLDR